MPNTINHKNVYDLDLQRAREIEHNNDLYRKDRPKWDEEDPEQSLIQICEYFETICRTNKARCLYMLCQHIIPIKHKNVAQGYYNADKTMIERCPIIPMDQHCIDANGVDAELLEDMTNLRSAEYLLDSAMCYAELKIITQNTPAETCINEFRKTRNFCAAYLKLKLTFLGPGFTQRLAGQLEEELRALTYKGEYKSTNFQTYIA